MVTSPLESWYAQTTLIQDEQERAALKNVAAVSKTLDWGPPLPSVASVGKRCVDILGAVVGLVILAILLPPIAIIMQLDQPGPLFFRQVRYGYRGKPFRIWKIRSMVPDAESRKHTIENEAQGPIFKNKSDPRITRFGQFLRRTSLDEVPQFLNVLSGDMSLVGTRPPVLNEIAQYEPHHWQRLNAKPGITGRWQTNGRSSVTDFEEIVEMDLEYQSSWSLWCDFKIILKTIAVLLGSRDAF